MHLVTPVSQDDFERLYLLRWQLLRQPWAQPPGSERDELEDQAHHRMLVDDRGEICAVGRLHCPDGQVGQIRYMAVADGHQGQGLGRRMLAALETLAASLGLERIDLNARETAVGFYQALGYELGERAHSLFGEVHHWRMGKSLAARPEQAWAKELTRTWHDTIPLARFMTLRVDNYDGEQLQCGADFGPNANLHGTLFAGSHYALATLTAWGRIWLLLRENGLDGDIVLADGHIQYKRPLAETPRLISAGPLDRQGLEALRKGRRARFTVRSQVCGQGQGKAAALFEGQFAVLPKETSR
ncbi:bifunctional GNAT family N-acetyltransferase/hotdog fold thioesterase [Gallaecimonas sp. GXIMD4217]|uniref:bifunctional GNAT family N-acetyltransferase/hotdog fold thioesterase n=1 Tax=Gallaecimonas sp. GXIMD4217 TaxID=3131927 RepID=UPI00311AE2DF